MKKFNIFYIIIIINKFLFLKNVLWRNGNKVRKKLIFIIKTRLYDPSAFIPLINKMNEGTLTIEEILDNTDATNDLKFNSSSQLEDM